MNIWRLHIKSEPAKGITRKEVLGFCQSEQIIGVGWSAINTTSENEEDIRKQALSADLDAPTACIKAINAMSRMRRDDLVWARLDGVYFLCKIGEQLWKDRKPNQNHREHDISNYVSANWQCVGVEEIVPGNVVRSFGPRAAVQRVQGVASISKAIWNKISGVEHYIIEKNEETIWDVLTAEMTEEIVLLYLQYKEKYILYPSTIKKSTSKTECIMVNAEDNHRAFVQVKTGVQQIDANEYMELLRNDTDKFWLFSPSKNYTKNSSKNIRYLEAETIERFMKDHISLLPSNIKHWLEALSLLK